MRFALPSLMYSATAERVLAVRVSGGTLSSTRDEDSWPMMRPSQRGTRGPLGLGLLWRSRRRLPMMAVQREKKDDAVEERGRIRHGVQNRKVSAPTRSW